ncbi:MAG TPA: NDP-sugar synthase [Armatimonadota bacterium]|nr:NDP-sugar synthase [Armatimonadota bacterium]
MDAILLVGGFGTRLMPLTQRLPKPLIPLANIPFVERQIAWLREAGVDHVILSLHYNAELFQRYFAQKTPDVAISFAIEDTPLGTGGAIKNCVPFLSADRLYICNGDIFTTLHLPKMLRAHRDTGARISIALNEVEDPSRFGVIETDADGRIHTFTEKPPRHLARSRDINAGIYLFEREVLAHFPDGPCSVERDIFPALLRAELPMHGYRAPQYWTDLGTPGDYLQAHRDILDGRVRIPLGTREILPGIWAGERVDIADDALLRPPLLIGAGARIGRGAVVGPMTVLGRGVAVLPYARVEDSIIWEGARVLRDSVVISSVIGRYAQAGGRVTAGLCGDGGQLLGIAGGQAEAA